MVAKMVSVDDVVAERPARALEEGEILKTGKYRFRFLRTPQVPHGWDASMMFEEITQTLFCSDLFHQNGDVEAVTSSDVVGRFKEMLIEYQNGPFADYMPYTNQTGLTLKRLAALKPQIIAAMHGSTFKGDGEQALYDLYQVMRFLLG
jgi:flavorubredoxin